MALVFVIGKKVSGSGGIKLQATGRILFVFVRIHIIVCCAHGCSTVADKSRDVWRHNSVEVLKIRQFVHVSGISGGGGRWWEIVVESF